MVSSHAHSRPSSRSSASCDQQAQSASRLRQPQPAPSRSPPVSFHDDSPAAAEQQGSEESRASTLVKATATSARERVVNSYHRLCGHSSCNESGNGECEHGILSPRASSVHHTWEDSTERGSGSFGGKFNSRGGDLMHGILGDAVTDGLLGGRRGQAGDNDEQGTKHTSTTEWLATKHDVKGRRRMYVRKNKAIRIQLWV
jgi:hypothetical protein